MVAKPRTVTWERCQAMALALPGVELSTSFGTPALKVKGKLLARLREDGILVLKPIEDDEQRFLMDTQPDTFFLTDHYRGYPCILIRLPNVDRAQLADLVEQCWRRLAPKKLLAQHDGAKASRVVH
jgi:hypothetical protein